MAENIQWRDGQAKDTTSVEKICPKRHITQNQWQSGWNKKYRNAWCNHCYDFISDYECIFNHPVDATFLKCRYGGLWDNLQAAKLQGTRVSIVNIAHFTNRPFARKIIKSGGFKGGMKKINEDAQRGDVKAKFSWWSPVFGEDDIKLVRDTLGAAIKPFLEELGDLFLGDGSDPDDEIDSAQDTEKGGDQENEEGSDQNDEIDSDQDTEKGGDQDIEESSDQNDEIDSNQDTEIGGDQAIEESSDQNEEINQEGSEQNDEKDDDEDDDDDQDNDHDDLQKQFASSNAFNPNAQLYGSVYFQYNINHLCECYRNNFDGHHEVQFKILGTFSYKKEVMHAVLICSQEYGNGFFKEYPPVLTPEEDINNEAVVTRDNNGNWVWKPQATGTDEIKRLPGESSFPKYRRWEHVAFAFHIPKMWGNDTFMSVPDLRRNFCPRKLKA